MGDTDKVLAAMKKAGAPVSAGQVADMTGMERKAVDKAMNELKKSESIESPVRCKWVPKA